MRQILRSIALLAALCSPVMAAEAPPAGVAPATPDVMAKQWVKALRGNDLAGCLALLTAPERAKLEQRWQAAMARPDPVLDLRLDALVRVAHAANASDQLSAMVQPYMAQLDPAQLSKQIGEIAGFLSMAADARAPGTAGGLDYAGLRDWLKDLAAWVPGAGLADQAKLRQAATHIAAAVKIIAIRTTAEARAMPLGTLLGKLGPALPELKTALAVYDVRVDDLLDSFTIGLTEATPEQATIALGFISLGKPRTIALKLVNRAGTWQLAEGNDNPIAGLSQLVMMSLLMHGMGQGAPAQPQAAPVDDGAL